MKSHFILYLLSAFILPLNAQTFPQPELWLRDTAAQVINPTTDFVRAREDAIISNGTVLLPEIIVTAPQKNE